MKFRILPALMLAGLVGCSPGPVVTKGTFTTPYTLTMQRGSIEVVVQTSGPASYTLSNYPMDHPMGPRPDTEATFITPAGTFIVSDRNVTGGLNINGTFYPDAVVPANRSTITIDPQGVITAGPPKPIVPQGP